jgi:hypothetical protein
MALFNAKSVRTRDCAAAVGRQVADDEINSLRRRHVAPNPLPEAIVDVVRLIAAGLDPWQVDGVRPLGAATEMKCFPARGEGKQLTQFWPASGGKDGVDQIAMRCVLTGDVSFPPTFGFIAALEPFRLYQQV